MQPAPPPKKPQKLSQIFKQQTKQLLLKQPPIYLISAIKDKNIILDLDLVQSDDINVITILFMLEGINKIVLFCQESKKTGTNGQVPIYGSAKFVDLLRDLAKVMQNSDSLKSLHILRVPLTPKHLSLLKQPLSSTHSLKQLSITHSSLTDQHLQTLKTSLSKNQSLVILDLSHNKLQNSGSTIGKIMSQHSTRRDQLIWFASLRGQMLEDDLSKRGICQVNVEGNLLDDKAVFQLVEFLKNDQWSRCLNLRGNRIGVEGVCEFAKLMKKNSSLISLDLRGNPGFTKQYSMYILKKLKQNIQKYKEQKKSFVKHKQTQQQNASVPLQKQNKYSQHKSLQQSRYKQKLRKGQTTLQFSTLNLNLNLNGHNNLTSLQKSQKNINQKYQNTLSQGQQCKKCKQRILTILKLQKNSLDLQLQLKKLKNILLTKNIDISAILPQPSPSPLHTSNLHEPTHNPNHQSRNNMLSSTLNQFLNPCQTDQDLLIKVQCIMNQLTKIMEHIDMQSHTQIVNLSNNGMSAVGELSNTIPIFVQQEELGELWESAIANNDERETRNNDGTTQRRERSSKGQKSRGQKSTKRQRSSKKTDKMVQTNRSTQKKEKYLRQLIQQKQQISPTRPKQNQSSKKQKISSQKQLNH